MSEYVSIKIKNLSILDFRNYLDNDIVGKLFSSGDIIMTPNYKEDPEDEDSATFTRYMYKTSVKKMSERLDALGYGIKRFEELFNFNAFEVIDYNSFLHNHLHIDYEDCEEKAKERIKGVTFQKLRNSITKIIKHELINGSIRWNHACNEKSIGINTECDKIVYYSLKNIDSEYYYALNTDVIPIEYVIRLIIDACDDSEEVILDFSNLENWADDSIPKALNATKNVEKTIVLVEGKSDKDILEFSLKYLYPHLYDLFYFMDFEDNHGTKRAGGTSDEVKNLKTFYYSKIRSKFIAVFDNDAEGYISKCILMKEIKKWPNNFRIFLYPDDGLFRKYPTLSPSGKKEKCNIIHKACSIELYLPDSIIKDKGDYYPIQWESRKKVQTKNGLDEYIYQGVISQKDKIKVNFHKLKKSIENGKEPFVPEDWERMKRLISEIVFAFV